MTDTQQALLKAVTIGWILIWGYVIGYLIIKMVEFNRPIKLTPPSISSPAQPPRLEGIPKVRSKFEMTFDTPTSIAGLATFVFVPALVVLLFLAFTAPSREFVRYDDYEFFGSSRSSGIGTGFMTWIGGIISSVLAGLITTYLTGK